MNGKIKKIAPRDIEAESFRIIEQELGGHDFDPLTLAVVQRVIHATGDFSFVDNLRFSAGAIAAGLSGIRAGKNILTDVNMAAAGVSRNILSQWGGRVVCMISAPETAARAKGAGKTRSEMAIELGLAENIGIVAIGNAPTALLKVMELIDQGAVARPDLVIGVPVGFVNAAESKELLACKEYPHITALGRKGGSPVAAAIVNALLRLAIKND
ncbi:MAG: precorrin-8X methylmutase [Desulfobacterales bacterium]|nr:precorrin-8X methylmutase [Desulfobacterales bacterium]